MKFLFAFILALISFFLLKDQPYEIYITISIVVFVATLWITEALPLYITALIVPFLISAFGVLDIKEALKPFASSVIFLVFGGLALSVVVEYNKLDKWIAFNVLKFAKSSPKKLYISIIFIASTLSMFISNTATTALLLPIIIGLSKSIKDINYIKMLLLATAYTSSVGGVATLIGTAPNAIAAEILKINFLEWFKYNFFLSLLMVFIIGIILWIFFRPSIKNINMISIENVKLNSQSKKTLFLLLFIIFLWFASPMLNIKFLNTTSIAILAVILIFILKLIPYKKFEEKIHWGILLLLGGGMSLGYALDKSGGAKFIAENINLLVKDMDIYLILLIIVFIAVFLTEIMSNTAVTAKFVPILVTLSSLINVAPEKLVLPFAVATSMAFMLPIATPPNALVFSTSYIRQIDMIKVGIILNIIAVLVISTWYYFII